MKIYLAAILLSLTLNAVANDKIIYGEDNRHDVYTYKDPAIVELSRSTVALIKKSDIRWDGNYYNIPYQSLSQRMNLCTQERFHNQPAAAFCSGFLVGPKKIITAGHCIQNLNDCKETAFVFDYKMANSTQYYGSFSNIFLCKKILGQKKDSRGVDFAVIEIDEEITDRTPLTLASASELEVNDRVFTIGHPSGLPTKITDNGQVRSIDREIGNFVTNLDTFGGNSGSPVFNSRTHEVEGILVRGDTDYVTVNDSCKSSNRVGNNQGKGETVSMISEIDEEGIIGDGSNINNDSQYRYIWFSWFETCNEFRGSQFVREVDAYLCRK